MSSIIFGCRGIFFPFFFQSAQLETLVSGFFQQELQGFHISTITHTCSTHVPQSKHSLQFSKLRVLKGIWKQKEIAADVRLTLASLTFRTAEYDLFA